MLQVIENNVARRSPCHSCSHFATDKYPDCNEVCQAVNDYLIALGDKPIPVSKISPELLAENQFNKKHCFRKYDYCNPEEFAQLKIWISVLRDAGYNFERISKISAMHHKTVTSLISGKNKRALRKYHDNLKTYMGSYVRDNDTGQAGN